MQHLNTQKTGIAMAIGSIMVFSSAAQAVVSGTINDGYVGQNQNIGSNFENTDDYTSIDYDIGSMDYSVDTSPTGQVTFTVRANEFQRGAFNPTTSSYFQDWKDASFGFGTSQPSDLFFSTDGWSPFLNGNETQAGFGFDEADNGTSWEYAIHLMGQTTAFSGVNNTSGTTQLYRLANGGEINNGLVRGSQEAEYNPNCSPFSCSSNNNPLGAGAWNMFDSNSNNVLDSMSITMNFSDFDVVWTEAETNGAGMGVHWTMRGAEDVIEGGLQTSAVPLPAAVYLFGTGLLGLVGIARRKARA